MKFCTKCGERILDEAIICPHCGCAEDNVNVGLCFLSVLIPLFGLIYWATTYRTTPKKAKACGITALISFVICFVVILLL